MPTFQGRILSVQKDEATGYYRIGTDGNGGTGSPKRLDTKREDFAREAVRLMREGSINVISYNSNQRHDTNSGRTYTNNYYEGLLAAGGGNGGDPLDGIPSTGGAVESNPLDEDWGASVSPDYQRPMDPESVWRVSLTAGAKLAVSTLPLMPTEQRDFETQRQIALAWAQFLVNTPRPASDLGFGTHTSSGQPAASESEFGL